MRRLLLTTITALLLAAAAHAAAPPPQWLPQDSWPGGKQYDARLGKTVKLWGTGVPAADLFASITKQTGVALGFSPPDDDNARLCLNVYLNPKEPPALRDLLVQIGWVMDCAWAVEGEGEGRRYVLLHTNLGEGALAQRNRVRTEADEARSRTEVAADRESFLRAKARLRELEADLALSREEAIKRYYAKDDLRLIVLLDPVRRAAVQFLLASPDLVDQLNTVLNPVSRAWSELTAEQRRWILEMIRAEHARWAAESASVEQTTEWDDPATPGRLGLSVSVGGSGTGFGCSASYPLESLGGTMVEAWANIDLLPGPRLSYDSPVALQLELRRLLGEKVPPEEQQRLDEEYWQEQHREALRHRAETQLAQCGPIAPETSALLSSSHLPVAADTPYALWQLQELTAATSGLHVISDHFWQPALPLSDWIGLLYPGSPPELTALTALRLATTSKQDLEWLMVNYGQTPPEQVEGWEWGDAGHFLRFRSRNRDLWRAALLPQPAAATLDEWLEPHLPARMSQDAAWPEVELSLDPVRQGRLLVGLSEEQRRWGGLISSGDPTDPVQAYRQTFREGILAPGVGTNYELLARLSEEQMQLLQGKGLVAGVDIPLSDAPRPFLPHGEDWGGKGSTLHLAGPESDYDSSKDIGVGQKAAEYRTTTWWRWRLTTPQGGEALLEQVPRNLLLRPQRLPHLVPPSPLQ